MSESNNTDSTGFGNPVEEYKMYVISISEELDNKLITVEELIDDIDSDWVVFVAQSEEE